MPQIMAKRRHPSLATVLRSAGFTVLYWLALCLAAGRAIWFW